MNGQPISNPYFKLCVYTIMHYWYIIIQYTIAYVYAVIFKGGLIFHRWAVIFWVTHDTFNPYGER